MLALQLNFCVISIYISKRYTLLKLVYKNIGRLEDILQEVIILGTLLLTSLLAQDVSIAQGKKIRIKGAAFLAL